MILVVDSDSRESIAEAITNLNAYAERQAHVLGWASPTPWDRAHAKLDALLEDYQRAAKVE